MPTRVAASTGSPNSKISAKSVTYARGDAVAVGGKAHRLEQRHGRRGRDVLLGDRAEAAGIGHADGREDCGGIRIVEIVEHLAQALAQLAIARQSRPRRRAGRTATGCRGWCCSRRRRIEASTARRMRVPTFSLGAATQGAAADGARLELGDLHAVAAGVDVHVAGFERVELGAAGGEEQIADLRLGSGGTWF